MRETQMKTPLLKWTLGRQQSYALSIRQPWAWLIVNGFKDVENRVWSTHHTGSLLIHAGASRSGVKSDRDWVAEKYGIEVPEALDFGGIIGIVELVECRERSRSRWHNDGKIGWVLKNPARLPFRTVKGQLKLFKPTFE
jgi:hypothetical protein